jgi:hypothetical protein
MNVNSRALTIGAPDGFREPCLQDTQLHMAPFAVEQSTQNFRQIQLECRHAQLSEALDCFLLATNRRNVPRS